MIYNINLYIDTTAHGPAIKIKGYYIYLLEYPRPKGPITLWAVGKMSECTENKLALTAFSEALKRVTKRSRINVFCPCGHVTGAIQNGWLHTWAASGWQNAKGQPVKNAELWQQVLDHWGDHIITAQPGEHSYSAWMRTEMERRQADDSKRAVAAGNHHKIMGK